MNQDVLYRPNIQEERSYVSDYYPSREEQQLKEPIPLNIDDTIQEIIHKSENIYTITEDLSASILDVVGVMINAVNNIAESIILIEEPPEPVVSDPLIFNSGIDIISNKIESEPINLDNFNIPELDYSLPDFDIEIESFDTVLDKMDSQYNTNLSSISNDFLDKLYRVLEKFTYELLVLRGDSGLFFNEEINANIDCDEVTLKDPSLQCYLDFLGKSQIIKDQKMRLFKKTHSLDETIYHLKNVDTAYQQFVRYYSQSKMDEDSYVYTSCNEILEDMVEQSRYRLKQSQNDLYKYYNSSTRIVEDYMNMQIKEIKCKTLLIMKGEELYGKSTPDNSKEDDDAKTG